MNKDVKPDEWGEGWKEGKRMERERIRLAVETMTERYKNMVSTGAYENGWKEGALNFAKAMEEIIK